MTSSLPNPDLSLSDTASQPDDQPISIPRTSASTQQSGDLESTAMGSELRLHSPDCQAPENVERYNFDAKTKISNLLKDKEREWTAVAERKGPLRLLDLPMDVLKEIVKEVTHTNDLTALALTHSALHDLTIPHIYSRFDIVWPDAHATTDPRTGVDALTYGLATLCMGDIYAAHAQSYTFACTKCGALNLAQCSHESQPVGQNTPRRLGNQYPQFTRKFSLGNGPADWVQEYLITKESGKMLGTLVALAVARMINLETFIWDMPTGVLRDVWLALSSLQNRNPSQGCRLERVWVRWHDNSDAAHLPPIQNPTAPNNATAGGTLTSIGWAMPPSSTSTTQSRPKPHSFAQSRVEYPTLSVLPPLKSLSVLDIDELDYLDEMSVLIEKSKDRLRELRVGISAKAANRDFAIAWDGPSLYQVDHKASWPGESTIGERRLGGVLGVLLGRVFDIRKRQKSQVEQKDHRHCITSPSPIHPTTAQSGSGVTTPINGNAPQLTVTAEHLTDEERAANNSTNEGAIKSPAVAHSTEHIPPQPELDSSVLASSQPAKAELLSPDVDSLTAMVSASTVQDQQHTATQPEARTETSSRRSRPSTQKETTTSSAASPRREKLDGRLRLQTLELERVSLSVAVLQKAFDWSVLANLTILDCPQHDRLWVMLRRQFVPTPFGPSHSSSKHAASIPLQYHLNLRKIHTDAASPALISFLKDTLAPNTLETLFLQDRRRTTTSSVTIDAIYRGPLKRHRASLRKLMLDSSDRIPRSPASASDNTRWRTWMPNRDVLNFITSGRMSSLRELSIAIDYNDWHHFLQRLPQIPHLRSLNIPFIADHVTPTFDPRELALQVVDVIVLRPEVELCYMGISHKCFEILENRPHDEVHGSVDAQLSLGNTAQGFGTFTDEEDEGSDEGSDEDDEPDEEEGNGTAMTAQVDPDETESEVSDHDDSDTDSFDGSDDGPSKVRLRLREILFYDDKVAIFKARHGKL